ncbi:sigma-54 interaction domain-containing protein [Paenibacillus humicola]|uniref:sigma-54 interaction domain-containing protein n=1 Tax=Paenibacillus humicola TaxID=3110540 RepID=UPI00237AE47E|nr:sigma 54-interacting transcriptional regulator [Paenibacillus humicola]
MIRKRDRQWQYFLYNRESRGIPDQQTVWQPACAARCDLNLPMISDLFENCRLVVVEDDAGCPAGYITSEDALQNIARSYRRLDAFFHTILETMDASISGIDEEGTTVIWTSGAEKLFSVSQAEIIGKPITGFFPVDMIQTLKTLKTGEPVYHQQHQPCPEFIVLINTNPVLLDGRIIGAIAAETDITSQIRLNRELFQATSLVHHLQQKMTKISAKEDPFTAIIGSSPAIQKTIETIKKLGSTNATALIQGESGVGKELFAKAIHAVRAKENAPFVAINCGAIPSTLFESELFGYEKGAFSGADQRGRKGKIEMAQGGTLFLDEIAEMPLEMQVKLLRVLEEKSYFPVGGTRLVEMNCAIVAATNRNLENMVKEGSFREDLFYRLYVVTVDVPPLRERKGDLLELIHTFLDEFSLRYGRIIQEVPYDVMQELLLYDWPGNVRELRNTIERLVVLSTEGIVKREYLPPSLLKGKMTFESKTLPPPPIPPVETMNIKEELGHREKELILNVLRQEKGNKKSTAKKLGISRASLYNKLSKWEK